MGSRVSVPMPSTSQSPKGQMEKFLFTTESERLLQKFFKTGRRRRIKNTTFQERNCVAAEVVVTKI